MDEQRRVFASYANRWASAMHSAASHLEKEGDASSSQYADWAGDGLDRFSKSVSSGSTDDFIKQANDFARNRPSLFMGSAVLAGIALAQLFKSSAPEEELPSGSRSLTPSSRSGPTGVKVGESETYPRAEAEYGELETRKPGAPHHKPGAPH